jgi:hypothetical protein
MPGMGNKPRGQRVSDEEVRRRYEAGESSTALAKELGYTTCGITQKVRRAGGIVLTKGSKHAVRGWWIDDQGYVRETVRPDWKFYEQMARQKRRYSGFVLQHRRLMADHLDRPLRRTETVHHNNGNRTDNRIENLQLHQRNHGNGVRLVCRCCLSDDLIEIQI